MGVLGHIESDDKAKNIIDRLMRGLPSGSYLAMYDGADTDPATSEATRIWNVADGTVETYPGTLDEYMDTCRQRQEQEAQLAAPAKTSAAANKPAAPKSQATVGPKPSQQAAPEKPREQLKKSKNRVTKLERESSDLEAQIGVLEAAQKERSELLAQPDVYADKERSTKLLGEFRVAQPELDKLTARWEQVQLELEELNNDGAAKA
jgi:ATP-binding cassette subfamily F protein 3